MSNVAVQEINEYPWIVYDSHNLMKLNLKNSWPQHFYTIKHTVHLFSFTNDAAHKDKYTFILDTCLLINKGLAYRYFGSIHKSQSYITQI